MNKASNAVLRSGAIAVGVLIGVLSGSVGTVSASPTDESVPATGDTVSVIVTLDPAEADLARSASRAAKIEAVGDEVLDTLNDDQVESVTRFSVVPAIAMNVDRAQLAALEAHPGVVDVSADQELFPLLAQSTTQVGAPTAWSSSLAGAGSSIAIIDTGVLSSHPMLDDRIVAEGCFTPSKPFVHSNLGYCPNGAVADTESAHAGRPCTGGNCGHGTAVASVAAGEDGSRRGVAHDAGIIAVNVFTSSADPAFGVGTNESSVIRALEWVYSLRGAHNIAAVNLSLGTSPIAAPCSGSAAITSIVNSLTAAGIAVVAASGNSGSISGISFPACLPNVVSVGSVGASGNVSNFSNISPALTLHAPGESIEAAWTSVPYATLDGTSFAAPHVAGAFAILRQQQPNASVSSLARLLDRTGDLPFDPSTGITSSAASIRIDRAIQSIYHSSTAPAIAQPAPPIGSLDAASETTGGIRVRGYVIDPDTIASTSVHVYVDGALAGVSAANSDRPDIAIATGYGLKHGFDFTVPSGAGVHTVCAYGIDLVPAVGNTTLGCQTVNVPAALGSFEGVSPTVGAVGVWGWALDRDTFSPIDVHVYVDGALRRVLRADSGRGDIAAAFPGWGPNHGFSGVIDTTGGPHRVCAYAIAVGVGAGTSPQLGCHDVFVPSGSPFGSLDAVSASAGRVRVAGWTIDPDTSSPVEMHVYVDGRFAAVARADLGRGDVAGAFPAYGAGHGFDRTFDVGGGRHRVCVYALNAGGGTNTELGCRIVDVPDSSPFGSLDSVVGGVVRGWTIDPDTADALSVHVYVDGGLRAVTTANLSRGDIGAAFPAAGPDHGFEVSVGAGQTVCAYAINVAGGTNTQLGCRTAG